MTIIFIGKGNARNSLGGTLLTAICPIAMSRFCTRGIIFLRLSGL